MPRVTLVHLFVENLSVPYPWIYTSRTNFLLFQKYRVQYYSNASEDKWLFVQFEEITNRTKQRGCLLESICGLKKNAKEVVYNNPQTNWLELGDQEHIYLSISY